MTRTFILALTALLLTGCGPVSTFMAVGQVVNAAGYAVTENQSNDKPVYQADPNYKPYREQRSIAEYTQAAERGGVFDQYKLGLYYLEQKNAQAYYWMCRAANNGYNKARLYMGHFYNSDQRRRDGLDFLQIAADDQIAYVWYSMAVAHGENTASLYIARMADSGMSAEHVQAAERLQQNWQSPDCGGRDGRGIKLAGKGAVEQ
jgi:TPR repeat protein